MRKLVLLLSVFAVLSLATFPVYAQAGEGQTVMETHWLAMAMAIAAAGCGIAQSRAVAGGCEGVSRNPGAVDTIRLLVILGLAFIEFLALLTFVIVFLIR
ncbi:MAG TPA: ATP synthase F0 subunit C [Acidobacteriota bacterium]|nr:ATP synthase F0 subunit C [Acidobacteriota bacterium]HRR56230.1 ATP synthase F0 subunit C [Acidobacteriota bacterium]HRV08206.1 ATP synthase F0 subunit C [Acidobacteriota bacterium]